MTLSALQSLLMVRNESPLSSSGIAEKILMSAVEQVINLPFFCTSPYCCPLNLAYVLTLSSGARTNIFASRSTGPTRPLSGWGAGGWGGEEPAQPRGLGCGSVETGAPRGSLSSFAQGRHNIKAH